jgi:hypothetical protein
MPSPLIKRLFDDEPRDDRPSLGQGDADEHERQDSAEHSRVAAHGDDATGRSNANTDGRAAKGETDVNIIITFFC